MPPTLLPRLPFPPPPPISAPALSRRPRAELWHAVATQWDFTRQLPPPPRNPMPEKDQETALGLPPGSRTPYTGDGWLQASMRWFDHVQSKFRYPAVEDRSAFEVAELVRSRTTPAKVIMRYAAQ